MVIRACGLSNGVVPSQTLGSQTTPVMPGFGPGIHAFLQSTLDGGPWGGTGPHPACFLGLLAPNRGREIGGGRATRQPGQVRKEAALTRSGSGRSSVSYLISDAKCAKSLATVCPVLVPQKPALRDHQLRIDR